VYYYILKRKRVVMTKLPSINSVLPQAMPYLAIYLDDPRPLKGTCKAVYQFFQDAANIRSAMPLNWRVIVAAPSMCKTDATLWAIIVSKANSGIAGARENMDVLLTDREFCTALISRDGVEEVIDLGKDRNSKASTLLAKLPEAALHDKTIVLMLMNNHPAYTVYYVLSPEMQKSPEVFSKCYLEASSEQREAMTQPGLLEDKQGLIRAIQRMGGSPLIPKILACATEELQQDPDVLKAQKEKAERAEKQKTGEKAIEELMRSPDFDPSVLIEHDMLEWLKHTDRLSVEDRLPPVCLEELLGRKEFALSFLINDPTWFEAFSPELRDDEEVVAQLLIPYFLEETDREESELQHLLTFASERIKSREDHGRALFIQAFNSYLKLMGQSAEQIEEALANPLYETAFDQLGERWDALI